MSVLDRVQRVADVYVVKFVLRVIPAILVLNVVYDELYVGRHKVGLDGREIKPKEH